MRNAHQLDAREHGALLALLAAALLLAAFLPEPLLAARYECVLHQLTGWNCPFCGMTRDFIFAAHGTWPSHNPGSIVVLLLGYVIYPAWLVARSLAGGDLRVSRMKVQYVLGFAVAILMVVNNL